MGSEGGTAESSPQSGAAGHLDIEDGDSVSCSTISIHYTISTISTQYLHNTRYWLDTDAHM